ncbi:unnamed protein product [Schistosoma margrebowiei]|uniref:Uncharacterized protein n=2 Tax=Schistosoma margrebowiei TaxID=48269 RepID=A0AA85AEM0_9TREM|nr:unnamed protein product [Schistosoma margrebowiei]
MCDSENPSDNSIVNTGCLNNTPVGNITLNSIMESIIRQRQLYAENILKKSFDVAFTNSHNDFWFDLFTQAFLSPALENSVDGPGDDLLFFVHLKQNDRKPELSVFRRNSSNLPKLTDDYVDWEETVYLNLLMQYFVYVVTVAVCTRTGPQEWQILKKFSQTVYASPSHRQMNMKGTYEEIVYPDLYFTIDNYEEAFGECVLRDSECINVELTAYDRYGRVHGVCFLGTVSYDTIKQFYDRSSQACSIGNLVNHRSGHRNNRMSNSCYSSSPPPNIDYTSTQFMRVLGPQAKGSAEIAIKLTKNITQQSLDLSKTEEMNRTNFITKCCQPVCPSELEMEYKSSDKWMLNNISWINKTEACKPTNLDHYYFLPGTHLDRTIPNNQESEHLQNIHIDAIPTLHPSPWSVKSAGASLHTSPVRRFKDSVGSKYASPRTSQQEFSPIFTRKCKFRSVNTINLYQESKPSKVSEILNAFTGVMTKQSLGNVHRTKDTSINSTNKPIHKNSTNIIMSLPTMYDDDHCNNDQFRNFGLYKGHLYENPLIISDWDDSSFGQAWSWFKERRRVTSVSLIASPTFITLPCQNILVELLEVRREPILNFTNQ